MSPIATEDSDLPIEVRVLMAIARLEEKLDNGLLKIGDHEGRIRELEQKQASPLRVYAVPLSLFGTFGSLALAVTALMLR